MDGIKLAFDSYVDWESKGGKELLLGANRLTNRQLFWFAIARSRYSKLTNRKGQLLFLASYYDINNLNSIKETFNCKVKLDTTAQVDSCSKNYYPINRPSGDFSLLYLKKVLRF